MSSTTAGPAAHGTTFRHEAFFYEGEREFLDGTVPFIADATAAGEPVLVVVDARKIGLLRRELDDGAGDVQFLDMAQVGQNPARIIPLWREFVDANVGAGARARGIGEPIWNGRSDAELTECQRHETLLNLAFDDGHPWSLLCPYDVRGLRDDILEEARRSHPVLADASGESVSDLYDPAAATRTFDGALPEPRGEIAALRYGAGEIAAVRGFVARHGAEAGLEPGASADLVLAVSELATNSVRHATGAGTVRLWVEDGTLLCEVSDGGLIDEPLVGRAVPPADALDGRGIWIVNQLCDLVQVRSSGEGTTVRLHMRI